MCDRFNFSDRAGAAVATTASKDFELLTEDKKKHIIDKSEVRKKKEKLRKDIREREAGLFHDNNRLYIDRRKMSQW